MFLKFTTSSKFLFLYRILLMYHAPINGVGCSKFVFTFDVCYVHIYRYLLIFLHINYNKFIYTYNYRKKKVRIRVILVKYVLYIKSLDYFLFYLLIFLIPLFYIIIYRNILSKQGLFLSYHVFKQPV